MSVSHSLGQEKSICYGYMGSCVLVRDIAKFIPLCREGRLPVDRLIDGYSVFVAVTAGFHKQQNV